MARRALAALACLTVLAACREGEPREPLLDSRPPPELASRFYPPEGWAWGLVQADGRPPQRYGVSSPPLVPRGEVVILPRSGQSAEAWFETARDLNARGVTVWVLDRAGQGGSARLAAPRGHRHVPDPAADVQAIRALRAAVVRGGPGRKVVLLADGDAAVPALRALQAGAPFDGLALSSPRRAAGRLSSLQQLAVRLGLGRLPASPWKPWRRDGPDDAARGLTHDPARGRLSLLWATANPDLRQVVATLATRAADAEADKALRDGPAPALPILVLLPGTPGAGGEDLVRWLGAANVRRLAGARPALHLERNAVREVWLAEIAAAAGARRPRPSTVRAD